MTWECELVLNPSRQQAGMPDLWRIYDTSDPSYEATICELWSGEQDNEALANYICKLHNDNYAIEVPWPP